MSASETSLFCMVQVLDKIETSLKLVIARTDAEGVAHSGGHQSQEDAVATKAQIQVVCTCPAQRERALSSWQSELCCEFTCGKRAAKPHAFSFCKMAGPAPPQS